jgi:hypothetical protein
MGLVGKSELACWAHADEVEAAKTVSARRVFLNMIVEVLKKSCIDWLINCA